MAARPWGAESSRRDKPTSAGIAARSHQWSGASVGSSAWAVVESLQGSARRVQVGGAGEVRGASAGGLIGSGFAPGPGAATQGLYPGHGAACPCRANQLRCKSPGVTANPLKLDTGWRRGRWVPLFLECPQLSRAFKSAHCNLAVMPVPGTLVPSGMDTHCWPESPRCLHSTLVA